jgi:hypothetical protein
MRWRPGMPSRDRYGSWATGLVLVAALVMAGVAFLAINGGSPSAPRLNRREKRLVSKLAVLRRPQQSSDRKVEFIGPIVPSLTRLVATLPGNWGLGPVRMYMVVRKRGRVSVLTVYGRRSALGAAGMAGPRLDNPRNVTSGLLYTVGVVPDGVYDVRWVFQGRPGGVGQPVNLTIHPMVHNNVAVAPVLGHEGRLLEATWYGPNGRAIRP